MTAVLKGIVTFIPRDLELISLRNSLGNPCSVTLTAEYSASIFRERNAAFSIAGEGERETSLPTTQYSWVIYVIRPLSLNIVEIESWPGATASSGSDA